MITILYEDKALVVCCKPVGVLSQGDGTEQSMETLLREQCHSEIFPVHRLDQNVSGVMVYAKTKTAAAQLSQQMQEHRVVKEYLAVVEGEPPQEGIWEDLLLKNAKDGKSYVVKRMRKGVKDAKLAYVRLQTASFAEKSLSLCHIRLFTGRSHQIRVQFSSRGYPLCGDGKYGSRVKESIALVSIRISFEHPLKKQRMCFTAPYPQAGLWELFPEFGETKLDFSAEQSDMA